MDDTVKSEDTLSIWSFRCFDCRKTIFNEADKVKVQHGGLFLFYHKTCLHNLPENIKGRLKIIEVGK